MERTKEKYGTRASSEVERSAAAKSDGRLLKHRRVVVIKDGVFLERRHKPAA